MLLAPLGADTALRPLGLGLSALLQLAAGALVLALGAELGGELLRLVRHQSPESQLGQCWPTAHTHSSEYYRSH